ncbi:MAG: hypothetical protein Q9225_001933 [Loekoesia sp. 1 TL-2023]
MPPWNPLVGHLYFCYKIQSELPKDAHPGYLPDMIRRKLPQLGPVYYLDIWPFGPQMLVVASTNALYQITQKHSLPKYHAMKQFLKPISEGLDIVTMEGDLWKTWRGIFNPGFSAAHLMTLTSSITDETHRFCKILQEYSQNHTVFKMKNFTDNLTMDIIGKVVLTSNPLVDGLRMQVRWLTFGAEVNPFMRYNPIRPLIHWYNTRRMNKYVSRAIESRFSVLQQMDSLSHGGGKSIVDLVLAAYLYEDGDRKTRVLDNEFRNFTMNQVKLFLFSGHDTTSSTVCYLFYVLASQPALRARIRAEHNSILGSSVSEAADFIQSNPFLLNQLPFTSAVIKETLRLYPAVSSTRAGQPGFFVTDNQGRHYPTDGFLVWANPQAIHRDPRYWQHPDDFIPERWLVSSDDPLHPIKGAWRPFEHGPRNCIGQELAMIEMKIILILTARRFNFKLAYEEMDSVRKTRRIDTVYGERGYQIERAQPSDDLPCRVSESID